MVRKGIYYFSAVMHTVTFLVAHEMEIEVGEEVAPEFVQELHESKVSEGETAKFECQISGMPAPEVHWYKDGKEVQPSDHIEMESLPDGTQKLVIHDAKPEDQGNYRVEATNAAGSMSSKAPLSVHGEYCSWQTNVTVLFYHVSLNLFSGGRNGN